MEGSLDLTLKENIEKVLAAIKLWIPLRLNALIALEELATRIAKVKKDKNIARTSTLPVAILGGATIVGAGVLSLCTAGLATPLMVAVICGTVGAISGSSTSGLTSLVCHVMEKRYLKAAQKIMDKDKKGLDDIVKQLKKIEERWVEHDNSITVEGKLGINSVVSNGTSVIATASRIFTPTFSAAKTAGSVAKTAVVGTVRSVGVFASAFGVVVDAVQLGYCIKSLVKGSPSEAAKKVREAIASMKENYEQMKAIQAKLGSKLSETLNEYDFE